MNEVKAVTDRVVSVLRSVPGVESMVPGGSRARGTHMPDSDIDIGIDYENTTKTRLALCSHQPEWRSEAPACY